jgi:hypothetical protein
MHRTLQITSPRHYGRLASVVVGLLLGAVACPQPRIDAAVKPVPADLDSAATDRWLAAERRACRGTFETLIDEGAVAQRTPPDSATTFRYFRRVTGVRCGSRG